MTRTKYLVEDSRVVRVFSDTVAQCYLVLQLAIILSPLDLFNQVIVTSHTGLPFIARLTGANQALYMHFLIIPIIMRQVALLSSFAERETEAREVRNLVQDLKAVNGTPGFHTPSALLYDGNLLNFANIFGNLTTGYSYII